MSFDPQVINAVLWHALEKSAGQQTKGNRDCLEAGSKTPVLLSVEGTIGKFPVAAAIQGDLTVGHDGSYQSTEQPDPATLLALALDRMPKTRRADFLREIVDVFTAEGCLPEPDEILLAAATDLLPKLTRKIVKSKRGAVAFVLPIEQAAAAVCKAA